jgi:hypothetical protein
MKKILLPLISAAFVSGCIDAELSVLVEEGEEVIIRSEASMAAPVFKLASSDEGDHRFCKNGVGTLEEKRFTCASESRATISDLMRGEAFGPHSGVFDASDGAVIRRLGDGVVEIEFDVERMVSDAASNDPEADLPEAIYEIMSLALAGHSIVLKVAGGEILSTTGKLSPDNRMAMLEVPLADILNPRAARIEPFRTRLRLIS